MARPAAQKTSWSSSVRGITESINTSVMSGTANASAPIAKRAQQDADCITIALLQTETDQAAGRISQGGQRRIEHDRFRREFRGEPRVDAAGRPRARLKHQIAAGRDGNDRNRFARLVLPRYQGSDVAPPPILAE